MLNPKCEDSLELNFGDFKTKEENCIKRIIKDDMVDPKYNLTEKESYVLEIWNEFLGFVKDENLGFPIWVDVFLENIVEEESHPSWKKNFIKKNLELYQRNKKDIDDWLKKHNNFKDLHKGYRKLEWQAGKEHTSLYECLIQFRPSGVRVKKPNVAPTLVASVQTPIYGPIKRRLTPKECARLQSFPEDFILNENENQAYKQLGNTINVEVAKKVIEELISNY